MAESPLASAGDMGIQPLVKEGPKCHGAAKPLSCNRRSYYTREQAQIATTRESQHTAKKP